MAKMTEAIADQASQIATERDRVVERIMADQNLSPAGKQRAVARAHQQAVNAMDALKANFQGGAVITADELGKRLFGAQQVTGADAVSMRDAHDRAAQVEDPGEARNLLEAAHMYGDEHLAKAVGHKAYQMSQTPLFGPAWAPVLEAYAASRPEIAEQLQEYHDARSQRTQDSLAAGFAFALPKPSIIESLHDHQIAELAGGDA
jgi:hypothetical protein